jgi:hypothetical protein
MNQPRFFLCAAASAILIILLAVTCSAKSADYNVQLSFTKPLTARVTAELHVNDGFVFTAGPAGGYQWDRFIKNLRLVREDSSVVPLQPAGRNRWSLPADDPWSPRAARAAPA